MLELERIAKIATDLHRMAPVAIRVNPEADAQGGAMRMGGKPAPFGIDEELLDTAFDFALSRSQSSSAAFTCSRAHRFWTAKFCWPSIAKGIQIAKRVAQRLGRPLRSVDFGGGLGVPYFANEHPSGLGALKLAWQIWNARLLPIRTFPGTRLSLSPAAI